MLERWLIKCRKTVSLIKWETFFPIFNVKVFPDTKFRRFSEAAGLCLYAENKQCFNFSFLGKDSPPPPPPDVAHGDLMMRLGLLLGDRSSNQIPEQMPHGQRLSSHLREESYTTVSSLGTSGDGTPDRGISDTSPMSTLTGKS